MHRVLLPVLASLFVSAPAWAAHVPDTPWNVLGASEGTVVSSLAWSGVGLVLMGTATTSVREDESRPWRRSEDEDSAAISLVEQDAEAGSGDAARQTDDPED